MEKEIWQKYRDQGVVVLGIDTDEGSSQERNARQFRDRHGLTYPILLDTGMRVADRYGLVGRPTHIVIDRAGVVRRVGNEDMLTSIEQDLNTLLSRQ